MENESKTWFNRLIPIILWMPKPKNKSCKLPMTFWIKSRGSRFDWPNIGDPKYSMCKTFRWCLPSIGVFQSPVWDCPIFDLLRLVKPLSRELQVDPSRVPGEPNERVLRRVRMQTARNQRHRLPVGQSWSHLQIRGMGDNRQWHRSSFFSL